MDKVLQLVSQKGLQLGGLTIGDCIDLAKEAGTTVGEVVIAEAMAVNKMSKEQVASAVTDAFCHNLYAMEIGLTAGSSFLMGTLGKELADGDIALSGDPFVDKALPSRQAGSVRSCRSRPTRFGRAVPDSSEYSSGSRRMRRLPPPPPGPAFSVSVRDICASVRFPPDWPVGCVRPQSRPACCQNRPKPG